MLFERQIPFHSRVAYYYDSLAGFIFGFFSGMVLSFVPVVARRLGASVGQMALISSSFAIGLILTSLWIYLTMRGKKMVTFYWPKLTSRLLFLLMPFVNTPAFFVGIVVLFYIVESIANSVYIAIMKEIYPDRDRARTMGYARITMNIAILTASFIGGRLLDWLGPHSYKIVFPIGAVLGLISITTFTRVPLKEETEVKPEMSFVRMVKGWFSDKTIWQMGGIISVAGFGNLLLGPLAPIFLVDKLKVSLSFVGLMATLASASVILSYYFWGSFIDRKGPIQSLRIVFIVISVVPVLYIVGMKWSVLLASIFSSFAISGWELATFKYISTRTNSSEKVQIDTGFFYTIQGIRGIIAPFVAVWLMKIFGLRISFLIAFLIIISGFILALVYGEKLKTGAKVFAVT